MAVYKGVCAGLRGIAPETATSCSHMSDLTNETLRSRRKQRLTCTTATRRFWRSVSTSSCCMTQSCTMLLMRTSTRPAGKPRSQSKVRLPSPFPAFADLESTDSNPLLRHAAGAHATRSACARTPMRVTGDVGGPSTRLAESTDSGSDRCAPMSVATGAGGASAQFAAGLPASRVTACTAAAARVPGDALTWHFESTSLNTRKRVDEGWRHHMFVLPQ